MTELTKNAERLLDAPIKSNRKQLMINATSCGAQHQP